MSKSLGNLLTPELLPDEDVLGYLGRLSTLNELGDPIFTGRALRKATGVDKTVPTVEVLSQLLAQPLETIVLSHTLLPFLDAFVPAPDEYQWLAETGPARHMLERRSVRRRRQWARVCRQCVDEDIGFRGFSYFRRTHQLPARRQLS